MTKEVSEKTGTEGRIYEVGYHLLSSIAEENIPAEVEKIKKVLAAEKAEIISEEMPKLRPLAYEIKKAFSGVYKKFDKAYFGNIKFQLPEGGDIRVIDEKLKANENILRYIVIKTVRENTMYSPKISVFKTEGKIRVPKAMPEKSEEKSASIEEIDQTIDKFVKEEVEK
jgi:ribosomal protein S6